MSDDRPDFLKKLGLTQEEFDAELEEAAEEYDEIHLPRVDLQKAQQFQELCSAIYKFQQNCESVKKVTGDLLFPKEHNQMINVKMGQVNLLRKEEAELLMRCVDLADHVQVSSPPNSKCVYFSFTVENVYLE